SGLGARYNADSFIYACRWNASPSAPLSANAQSSTTGRTGPSTPTRSASSHAFEVDDLLAHDLLYPDVQPTLREIVPFISLIGRDRVFTMDLQARMANSGLTP